MEGKTAAAGVYLSMAWLQWVELVSADENASDLVTNDLLSLSLWDGVMLAVFAAFVVYWFFVRKPKDPEEDIKPLSFHIKRQGSDSLSSGFIERMQARDRKIALFYGSQTGTAEDFSTRLAKDARRMGIGAQRIDPDEIDPEDILKLRDVEDSLALFVVATYGEGDPTDNAQRLYDWLKESDSDFSGFRYAVFGLGNKTYEHYNAVGRFFDKRLAELGGERFFRLGEGDDDARIEEDFMRWREDFLEALRVHYNITGTNLGFIREYELVESSQLPNKIFTGEVERWNSYKTQKRPFNAKNPFLAPIRVHKELHCGGDRSCMHIELDITNSYLKYSPGDHVAIYPINDGAMVEAIGERLNTNLDDVFMLTSIQEASPGKESPFPCPCSYRTALTYYIDIMSPPRTNLFEALLEYTSDSSEKAFLEKIVKSSEEGRAAYENWVRQDGRCVLDVLNGLPSTQPPLDLLLEVLPRLQCRYYSISSSPKVHPDKVHVTATTHHYKTRTGREGMGVATRWLRSLKPFVGGEDDPKLPIYIRKSTLHLPLRPATPIIMIGPGTGLAPFRAFVQQRNAIKSEDRLVGETRLYFGCRHKAQDFIYREELEEYEKNGSLSLRVAFSRDQQKKVYVTHLLKEDGAHIWKMLEDGAHLYVCGDAKNMARDVHATLLSIISERGETDEESAANYIKSLKVRGRYVVDAWS